MKKISEKQKSTLLWYTAAAEDWNEALPVGNGRIGGMVFGRVGDELVQLNEDSIWSGYFRERNNPKALKNLGNMRSLIDEGRTEEAEKLCAEAFFGTNDQERHYQPLGDLHIRCDVNGYTGYTRSLDLERAVAETEYESDGVHFRRSVFVSAPDDVLAVVFEADKTGMVSFTAEIDGRDDYYDRDCAYDDKTLLFSASSGIPFTAAMTVCSVGGNAYTDANRIVAEKCDKVYLLLACQTAYRTADHEKLAISQAKRAARIAKKLYSRHYADYSALFDRCELTLGDDSSGESTRPTDERLKKYAEGADDSKLCEMYFNFSRYLMISGSRPGTLPLNLQGIWNKDMWPAWGSKYTVNINTEMNYWGADAQYLPECVMPLIDHIERMRENGRVTARVMYGCGGTVCHHNTDIWGDTAPQDKWMPGTQWPMGMAWLCIHIYEHYLYTLDEVFLAEKYDTMAEAAEFFLDFLTDDGSGRLVTSPSVSPENTYITKDGRKGTICKGPSMDSQILHTLFTDIIEAAHILHLDDDEGIIAEIKKILPRLPQPQIGKYGQIMEWSEDYDEAEPGHRHISQMFALYPSDMITPEKTPSLAQAARATIERRLSYGGGHTGWSRAWIINMWARLRDGGKVAENIRALLSSSTSISLLDMHPPFQIDGNFGGGAGIAEAIMQSHSGEIILLPALPPEWKSGSVSHLRARGGFDVSFEWENGAVVRGVIVALKGRECRIRGDYTVDGMIAKNEDGCTVFYAESGRKYNIVGEPPLANRVVSE